MLPAAAERGIAIDLHADGPAAMTADRGEIEIILNNLVSNAVKYNRDNGRVDVTVSRADGRVTIHSRRHRHRHERRGSARLFNDFVRIKNDKTRNILGSGLGLSIVKKLAVLYGGDAVVKPSPTAAASSPSRSTKRPSRRFPRQRPGAHRAPFHAGVTIPRSGDEP